MVSRMSVNATIRSESLTHLGIFLDTMTN